MPWKECSTVSQRAALVKAMIEETPVTRLCGQVGISRTTAYKWMARYRDEGPAGLEDRSRRPHHSPQRTAEQLERAILEVRAQHPAWGGRKIRSRLLALGHVRVPVPSTITAILHRHGWVDPAASLKHQPLQRFEHPCPNDLWQMDFKGHFPLNDGSRCHPLTVLDDHARFSVGLRACGDEQGTTVQPQLIDLFRRYGLPQAMLMDNGGPWGLDREHPYTLLTAWLIRLGIRVIHSRPYHPQTQGKDERFHRTLEDELLRGRQFDHLAQVQTCFDRWREMYNCERPHEALQMSVPASRYRPSPRVYPEVLPPIEYSAQLVVRKVQDKGEIFYRGRMFKISKAFRGYPVGLRPTDSEGVWEVYFCQQAIARIDVRTGQRVSGEGHDLGPAWVGSGRATVLMENR